MSAAPDHETGLQKNKPTPDSFRSKLRLWIGPLAVLLVVLALWQHSDAWQTRYLASPVTAHIGYGIFSDQDDIDIAFFGSSRSWRGIVAEDIRDNLISRREQNYVIRDFSHSGAGMGIRYAAIKDLLKHHAVNLLVVEHTEKQARYETTHPLFFRVATQRDLLSWPLAQQNFLAELTLKVNLLAQKYAASIATLGGRWSGKFVVNKPPHDFQTLDVRRPNLVYSELINWYETQLTQRNTQEDKTDTAIENVKTSRLDHPTGARTNYFIQRIVALAKQTNTPLVFIYFPRLMAPAITAETKAHFKQQFGAELWSLSQSDLDKIYQDGYADRTHFNKKGSTQFQATLMDYLWPNYSF